MTNLGPLRSLAALGTLALLGCTAVDAGSPKGGCLARAAQPSTSPAVSPKQPVPTEPAPVAPLATSSEPSAAETSAVTPTSDCHWVVVGDSLTDPRSHGGGYVTQAASTCGCRVTNLARGGFMVNQMRRRIEREIANGLGGFSHLIVFGGVNDLYSDETAGRTPAKIERDLEAIYRLGRERHASVVAITVAPWGGFQPWYTPKRGRDMSELNSWLLAAPARGITDVTLDSTPLLSCGDRARLCDKLTAPFRDGIHFGPPGHAALGHALAASLCADRSTPTGPSPSPTQQEQPAATP